MWMELKAVISNGFSYNDFCNEIYEISHLNFVTAILKNGFVPLRVK
jgi:hypothetical protein